MHRLLGEAAAAGLKDAAVCPQRQGAHLATCCASAQMGYLACSAQMGYLACYWACWTVPC